MTLSAINNALGIVFPLISFPYITRVLGVENIGKYNFANSIISYFILLAGLGIATYAVREGAAIREKREKIDSFASQMFSINLLTTVFSYLLLFCSMIVIPKFSQYSLLLGILSIQVIFTTVGVSWVYSIYEDYLYITIRSVAIQVISLIGLFTLVKNESNIHIYVMITVIAATGANIVNFFHSRKYCKILVTKNMELKRHIKPILTLFVMSFAVTIYVSSGTTILGLLTSDSIVGIYSVSVRIYTIIKSVLGAFIMASIPRLSNMLAKGDVDTLRNTATDIYKTLCLIMIPAIVGIVFFRKEVILILSDSSYLSAGPSLVLLSIAILFALCAGFWSQGILIPAKKEKTVMNATIASALANIVLNLVFIPLWQENGTALATVFAEIIALLWCANEGKKVVQLGNMRGSVLKILAGCIGMIAVGIAFRFTKLEGGLFLTVSIGCCMVTYFLIEILLKNDALTDIVNTAKRMFHR